MLTFLTPELASILYADRLREAERNHRASHIRGSAAYEPGLWIVRLWSRAPRRTSAPRQVDGLSVPPSHKAA